jgi:nucleoid-associated protein YgaU
VPSSLPLKKEPNTPVGFAAFASEADSVAALWRVRLAAVIWFCFGQLSLMHFNPGKEDIVADFQALQQKYSPVVDTIKEFEPYGAKFVGSDLVGEQYHLVAQVPSQVVENRVWDAIPTYSDLKHEITNTGGQEGSYTIQAGDNLSKVSKLFYGNANKYEAIAKANNLENPDKIQVGQTLKIPVL